MLVTEYAQGHFLEPQHIVNQYTRPDPKPASPQYANPNARPNAPSMSHGDKYQREWNSNLALHEEFSSFDAYRAYCKATESGLARRFGGK